MESSRVHQGKCGGGSLHSEERKDPACVSSCQARNEHGLYPPGHVTASIGSYARP